MPIEICNNRSTTLFEIIIATVIFSLVMAGMVSVFVAGKGHIMHTRDRMASSEMGKFFLEPLGLAVRQDSWGSGDLSLGSHSGGAIQHVNTIPYTSQYEVSDIFIQPDSPRRVFATISWTEN